MTAKAFLAAGTIAVALGSVVAPGPHAAPITTNTALPVSEDQVILREQVVITRASGDPTSQEREFDGRASVTTLGYGVTSRLALFGTLPVAHKHLELPGAWRASSGLGDVRVFARYTILQQDEPGRTFRVAPFAGVELPTGEHRKRDSLGLLPPSVQPGSGSWDPFGGIVATYATTAWQLDAVASYQANTERAGREDGDIARADLSFQYRLLPARITADTEAFVFGVLETNLIFEEQRKLNGLADPNTGGTTLFLAPGLQYAAERFIAEAAVQIPVVQDLNGDALEKDFIGRVSVRFNF